MYPSESKKETVITEKEYKTPQYLRDCQKRHNDSVEIIRVDFPIGTKERMQRLGIEKYGPYIRSIILKILDMLEKTEEDESEYENSR